LVRLQKDIKQWRHVYSGKSLKKVNQTGDCDSVVQRALAGKEVNSRRGRTLYPYACLQESPQSPSIPESCEAAASVRRDPARARAFSQRYQ